MKILMVLEREFPEDDRVQKEAESLIAAGHDVHLACYTFENRLPKDVLNNITIYRKQIKPFTYKSSAACLVIGHYFKFWKKFLSSILLKQKFEAIHVHDLPLSKIAYQLAKKFKLKFIADQHEYYSNWIVHTAHMNTFSGKILKVLSNWKKYEKKYLNKADLVITIEEPLRECYLKDVGIESQKIILVPNTPLHSVFNSKNIDKSITNLYKDKFVLFYAGGIDRLRGLEIALKAIPILKERIKNIKLIIGGKESKNFNLNKLIESLNIKEEVDYIGWIDINKIPSYLSITNLGFFTPPGNRDEIHNTIATKIYQYAIMEVPVIVSDVKLMKQFVLDNQFGFVANDTETFAMHAINVYNNVEEVKAIIESCKKRGSNYSWEETIKTLLSRYGDFESAMH